MLELPLPPFYNGFGRAQRRLAAQYDVVLVPRREFAAVLAARGATLDTIHLSPRGHDLMAELVWRHVGPYFSLHAAQMSGGEEVSGE